MDLHTDIVELMSPQRYRALCQAGLAGMLNNGTKRVYTPNGWAPVQLIDAELETDMREAKNRICIDFVNDDLGA